MFELAPVSLWLEDLSDLRGLMDQWRAHGVVDFDAFLRSEHDRVTACFAAVRLIKVNRRTLTLFEADSIDHLVDNLSIVFQNLVFDERVDELCKFWNGETQFSIQAVNYTLSGRPLDIQLSVTILPGHEHDWARVLIAIEDFTEREAAYRARQRSESYFRRLFEHSPVSLWVQDFSEVKVAVDNLRAEGVTDFPLFLEANPDVPRRLMEIIRVRDVNSTTLRLFKAPSLSALTDRLGAVFRPDCDVAFSKLLVAMWTGEPFEQEEMLTHALDGTRIHVQVQCSILSEHHDDWSLILLALSDITARKEAEAHLEFLNTHDVITRLFNRTFYVDELTRLEAQMVFPVSIVVADLNGLKQVNDCLGHAAGDTLLRRCGEILNAAAGDQHHAARIGGDEFVILMPHAGADQAVATIDTIDALIATSHPEHPLMRINLAIGAATSEVGEPLDAVFARADAAMYACKQAYYAATDSGARRTANAAPRSSGRYFA